ncbi:MerR family transcriptional regulator [Nocardiopsis coralliicola]
MRMAELSRQSGVPVATIKYYLREGLLPKGEALAATQASYGPEHIRRLRLIRALSDVAGLPLATVRGLVSAVDDTGMDLYRLLGSVQYTLATGAIPPWSTGAAAADAVPAAESAGSTRGEAGAAPDGGVDALLAELGWQVQGDAPDRAGLARTLAAMDRLGFGVDRATLRRYAAAAQDLAAADVAAIDGAWPRERAVEYMAVRCSLMDAALASLRRMAQEDAATRRFAGPADAAEGGAGAALP